VPVLDTDTLSVIQRRAEPQLTRLKGRLDVVPPGTIVWVTIVSFEEQLRGWLEYIKRAKPQDLPARYAKLRELNEDFATRPVLPFDTAAADTYERLLHANTRVGAMDLRVAAIAISRDEPLISMNLRHFRRIPDLRVEDWTRPLPG
jgi:tRNA(fMet)-specific endonuclease VapC